MNISAIFNGMKISAIYVKIHANKQEKTHVINLSKGTNPHKFFTIHSLVFAVVYKVISLGTGNKKTINNNKKRSQRETRNHPPPKKNYIALLIKSQFRNSKQQLKVYQLVSSSFPVYMSISCKAISELLFASVSKRVFAGSRLYKDVFHLQIHFHAYQTHFHMKGFARGLVLRHKTWPISCCAKIFSDFGTRFIPKCFLIL